MQQLTKIFVLTCVVLFATQSFAQQGERLDNGVVIYKDPRLQQIREKEVEANISLLKSKARTMRGYRLMILNTSNKDYAFNVRTELLQKYPEQKPYMWFANPYIRLKFGNFRTREEAETYRRQISDMLGGANIYLLQETIEVVPGDDFDPDSMREEILK